jgi:hypothetical protein
MRIRMCVCVCVCVCDMCAYVDVSLFPVYVMYACMPVCMYISFSLLFVCTFTYMHACMYGHVRVLVFFFPM